MPTAYELQRRGLEFVQDARGVFVSVRGPVSIAQIARDEVQKRVPLMLRPPVNFDGARADTCDSCTDPMGDPSRDGRRMLCELCELARRVALKGAGG